MIKFDGYYKLKTVPVKDSIANHTISGYHHMAFLFQKNGEYITASDLNQFSSHVFRKQDFDKKYSNNYIIQNNKLLITHYSGKAWEFIEIFERINDNLFENDKQKLTFVKWHENE